MEFSDVKQFLDLGALGLLAWVLWQVSSISRLAAEKLSNTMTAIANTLSQMQRDNHEHYGRDDAIQTQILDRLAKLEARLEESTDETHRLIRIHCGSGEL